MVRKRNVSFRYFYYASKNRFDRENNGKIIFEVIDSYVYLSIIRTTDSSKQPYSPEDFEKIYEILLYR